MTTSPDPHAEVPGATVPDEPARVLLDLTFTVGDLPAVRRAVAAHAGRTPLPPTRVGELVLIASELAANAIRHGGGTGRLLLRETPTGLSLQVSDDGPGLPDPAALPRQRPEPTVPGGRGMWIVRSYADTMTVTNSPDGGAVVSALVRHRPADQPPTARSPAPFTG